MRSIRTILLVAVAFMSSVPRLAADRDQEYAIKAAFLYNIAHFVEWPEAAFRENAPFVISVVGSNPFGDLLEAIVQDQTVNNRPIVVRYTRDLNEARMLESHLIFLVETLVPPALPHDESGYTLIVGDAPEFATRGGMIGLVRDRDRVRLHINRKALERAGLRASSRLLGVAILVDGDLDPA